LFIKEVNQKSFNLRNNFLAPEYQKIFPEVCSIHFENLTTINISFMHIRNIEAIQFLSAPNAATM
jgi:hypothetical protein